MQSIIDLYTKTYGAAPANVAALAKAGSNRRYYRLTAADGATIVGVVGTSQCENGAFISLARHFGAKRLNVPSVVAVSEDGLCYLQTDLGSRSLYDALSEGRALGNYSEDEAGLLCATIRQLARIQILGAEGLDFAQLLPPTEFDLEAAMFDLNYFKYCFLKTTDVPFDEVHLEADMKRFAADLVEIGQSVAMGFLYRDFQARNVMLVRGEPFFIDFQGGMRGPLHYDVASFLWQASAKYSEELRHALIDAYLDELQTLVAVDREAFRAQLRLFVLFRTMQVLGAYGLRGYFEQKAYFLASIPHAIKNLQCLLEQGACGAYPCLERVLSQLVATKLSEYEKSTPAPAIAPLTSQTSSPSSQQKPTLKVRVFSFSYKKSSIPHDESGNGGGYVFDCRSTHNPGRYEPYKKLTGLDAPVVEFLENDGEIFDFLKPIYTLADAHVERYMQRGFTDLMFAFGCTGGQHRSVYSAQHLAERLHAKYGIHVVLSHIEQGIHQEFLPA